VPGSAVATELPLSLNTGSVLVGGITGEKPSGGQKSIESRRDQVATGEPSRTGRFIAGFFKG
jgi:hypothetical protein